MSSPAANGTQMLSVSVTSPTGSSLGQTSVTVPNGGWWAVGLGPGVSMTTPIGGGTPIPVPSPPPTGSGGSGGSVTTPEPTSLALLGFGGLATAGWRLRRRIA